MSYHFSPSRCSFVCIPGNDCFGWRISESLRDIPRFPVCWVVLASPHRTTPHHDRFQVGSVVEAHAGIPLLGKVSRVKPPAMADGVVRLQCAAGTFSGRLPRMRSSASMTTASGRRWSLTGALPTGCRGRGVHMSRTDPVSWKLRGRQSAERSCAHLCTESA